MEYKKDSYENIPNILKLFIKDNNKNIDTKKIIKEVKSHKLLEIFYYELINSNYINYFDKGHIEKIKKTAFSYMFNTRKSIHSFEKLYNEFNNNNLTVVALKGLVLREYYKNPDFRNMGDWDLLILEDEMGMVENILIEDGYIYDHETKAHKVYLKDKTKVELHTTLIDVDYYKKENPYKENVFKTVREIKIGEERVYALEYNNQLIHLITHMLTHVASSSIGIRQITDVTLFVNNEKENIDFERFYKDVKNNELYDFAIAVLKICDELFKLNINSELKGELNNCNNKLKDMLIESIFDGGIGVGDNLYNAIGNQFGYDKDNSKNRSSSYLLKRYIDFVFPRYEIMKNKYTYCNNSKILLPIAWIHRIITGGVTKEVSLMKKSKLLSSSFKISKKKNKLLKMLNI
ncbi:MAG: nucleotidyltransferase domain-containing protein [Clostridium sp.]|uniref:nucleotidyltransferase domain-containing protein n=1 Tax=Clostridium sp. TaxID=1506 RepID=UPI003F4120BD